MWYTELLDVTWPILVTHSQFLNFAVFQFPNFLNCPTFQFSNFSNFPIFQNTRLEGLALQEGKRGLTETDTPPILAPPPYQTPCVDFDPPYMGEGDGT